MAVQTTEEFKNGGATTYSTTIEYLKTSDIKVRIGGALQTYVASSPSSGEYTVSGTTVTLGAQAAAGSGNVHIYRETDVNTPAAVFAAGSSIRAADLNAIHDMARFGLSEARSTTIESDIKDGAITSSKIKDDTIVNADINASAAIAGTKVSPNFGSQNIVTTGTGATGNLGVTGNITVSGTVDGRDVATDGSKLDGIEAGATADQTNAEIRSAVEAATDSNVFTDADHTKLNGIETGATADQTAAEIRTLVDNATDSNVFTDADHTKLNGIETGATADQSNAEIRAAVEAASDSNVFTDADHTKLNGIETGATADQTGAEIKTAYEAESNTNAFTDAEKTKLGNLGSLNALSDVNTSGVADGKILKYQASSSSFIIADDGGSGSGGATAFTGLSDTPANYGSAANKTLKVNSSGNAVEFVDVTTSFVGLTDTPSSLSGQGGKTLKVNSSGNAVEFVTAVDVTDGDKGDITVSSSGATWTVDANAITSSKIIDDAIITSKIIDDAVTADKLANSINTEIAANTAKVTNATHTGEVTGGTALTIADDVVDEANLKISNAGTNGQFLSKQSGNTGGLTWATVPIPDSDKILEGNAKVEVTRTSDAPQTGDHTDEIAFTVSKTDADTSSNNLTHIAGTIDGHGRWFIGPQSGGKSSAPNHLTDGSGLTISGSYDRTNDVTGTYNSYACLHLNNASPQSASALGKIYFSGYQNGFEGGSIVGIPTGAWGNYPNFRGTDITVNLNGYGVNSSTNTALVERWRFKSSGALAVNGISNIGTAGQVLTSQGDQPPTWEDGASTVAGGAIYENSQTISASHTIPVGSNGMSAGPVTVNNGVTLTISNGSTYTIV